MEVKVEIFPNSMTITTDEKMVTVQPNESFTTTRLLVGNFSAAVSCLKGGLEEIGATGVLKLKPSIVIRPRAMLEGGLSEIEERTFQELGHAAGAKSVVIQQ